MDFCESENRSHIVETERQLLETEFSREFEEDLNMAIGEDDTENGHEKYDEEDRTDEYDDNEDSEQDSKNESLLSDENLIEDNEEISSEETNMINIKSKKCAADEEDETVNKESTHSNISEQSDNEDLWEDIYGRQRDKEGNIVSKKYVPPAARVTSNNISSDDEKVRRLEKQMKGILNRLAEQNMHTIANQVINLRVI